MEMGILGLPQSGKSTLFEIMTGVKSSTQHNETVGRGLAAVPDERFDKGGNLQTGESVSGKSSFCGCPCCGGASLGSHPAKFKWH